MFCVKPLAYKRLNYNKCSLSRTRKFCLTLVVWIIGMLLISSLAVLLMILSVSSFASNIPNLSKSLSVSNHFSKVIPMEAMQPDMRPLKPTNHKLMNMPQVNTPSPQHETLRLLERLEIQPNYYHPRHPKEKLLLPGWRLAHLPHNNYQRLPLDRSSFSSQIPRPPRLTRTLSENRRRYTETDSEQPRPFNFPLEGPQPSEFKKTKSSKKENIANKTKKVNNIQDILRQEQAGNVNQYRMPVGIHISGSFKNLQNSGVSNVFRNYVQMQPQMSPSQLSYQRMSFDPFYPYKPKSLNEINSLAMKQLRTKKKKKAKNNMIPGLIFQQSGHRPLSTDFYLDALRINNSLKGQRNLKNEPFSLKLEVYPIRSGKKAPIMPVTDGQFVTTIQPSAQNFEPFYPQIGVPYAMPINNGASYFNYVNTAQKYKGRFLQLPNLYSSAYQRDKLPSESDGIATQREEVKKPNGKKSKANSNQLMLHLNVFPSKKDSAPVVPQNHLYDVIHADVHERSTSRVAAHSNETSKTIYDCENDDDGDHLGHFDYQHHKIGKDTLGASQNFVERVVEGPLQLKLNETMVPGVNGSENAGDKLSTFRFPVENLMQFQANDAVI